MIISVSYPVDKHFIWHQHRVKYTPRCLGTNE